MLSTRMTFGAEGEQDLQQHRLQKPFRRHRGPAGLGVDGLEFLVHRRQHRVHQNAQFAQRVVVRNKLFQAHVGEHRALGVLAASHLGLRVRVSDDGI